MVATAVALSVPCRKGREDDRAEAGERLAPSQTRASLLALAQASVGVPSDQAFPCLHFNDIQQSPQPCFVI